MTKTIRFDLATFHSRENIALACQAHVKAIKGKKIKRLTQSTADGNILEAMRYASIQMADPEVRSLYESQTQARGRSANTLAIFDYLVAPTIRKVDATKYTGAVGQTIRIRAHDDFMVTAVTVLISDPQGELVERGAAIQQAYRYDQWVYTITAWNESLTGCVIIVNAHDLAGNTTSQTLTLQ